MADGQPVLARGRPAVFAADDLQVGAAHPDGPGLDQHRPVGLGRLGELGQVDGVWLERDDGDGAHGGKLVTHGG